MIPMLGDLVMVTAAVDREIHDVSEHIGRAGKVVAAHGDAPCVMYTVRFVRRDEQGFWEEELSVRKTGNLVRTCNQR